MCTSHHDGSNTLVLRQRQLDALDPSQRGGHHHSPPLPSLRLHVDGYISPLDGVASPSSRSRS